MNLHKFELLVGSIEDFSGFTPGNTVVMMMSGGVDSSVAASKLQEDGWNVVGVNMLIPLAFGESEVDCSGVEEVAVRLGIPLLQIDLNEVFRREVIDVFEQEYRCGRTPNPCCDCNRRLKFGYVWEIIEQELAIKHLATGHYARIVRKDGRVLLARGFDENKDQSYFIYGIAAERLPYFHLPLGELNKEEVRRLARKAGLAVHDKSESMELCFAGGGDYREALSAEQADLAGDFVDSNFKVLGKHKGIRNYTVGQRKLGRSFGSEPSYVLQVIPEKNMVMVGKRSEVYKDSVLAEMLVIHQPEFISCGRKALGKIRSAGVLLSCTVEKVQGSTVKVIFDQELFAPTPGQHLVLYNKDNTVIAGGVIC